MTDINRCHQADLFPGLSRQVMEHIAKLRDALFSLNGARATELLAESATLSAEARKAEAEYNAGLLVGISSPDERFHFVRCAQRCSRLGRIVHQASQIAQNLQEIAGNVTIDDITAFKPIYLMAEVELKDAVLSILRDDEQLAYGVQKKDEELDELYAAEMERIFHNTSSAMFYNFQTGTGLLFILRAIERIGDHAKQLAMPSFYLLSATGAAASEKK